MNPAGFADAAHELNNLLQIIALRIGQVSMMMPESDPVRHKMKAIEGDLWRCIPMVNSLLGAKKTESGDSSLSLRLLDPAAKHSPTAASKFEDGRPVLLYIDDNPDRLGLLKPILELNGYRVITAQGGPRGLEVFLSEPIELVVLDYFMPTMKGDEVAQKMRQSRPDIPIVIFSGALTLPEMVIAIIDGFVSTSEEPGALLTKIASLLGRQRAQAS